MNIGVILLVLIGIAYFAEGAILKFLYKHKGVGLKSHLAISTVALGSIFSIVIVMTDDSMRMAEYWWLFVVAAAAIGYLLFLNIKGAGVLWGIAVSVTQALSAGVVFLKLLSKLLSFGVAIATGSPVGSGGGSFKVGYDYSTAVQNDWDEHKKREEERKEKERQDAFAQRYGFDDAKDAWDKGHFHSDINPDLFDK